MMHGVTMKILHLYSGFTIEKNLKTYINTPFSKKNKEHKNECIYST
jgi:hypothetical protein